MQSQPRNIPVSFERSKTDPSMNSAPLFRCGGARTSRMTGVSPRSSSLGARVCPRFPDPPVSSTFMVFSPTYTFPARNWQAGLTVRRHRIDKSCVPHPDRTRRNGMARRNPLRKVKYFEPVAPRLGRTPLSSPPSRSAGTTAARCASIAAGLIRARLFARTRRMASAHA